MKDIVQKAAEGFVPQDASLDARLYIGTKEYEIDYFETELQQDEDYKGQPQHEVKGGLLTIRLKQVADSQINSWMFKRSVTYSGSITFAPIFRVSPPPITIIFENGKCISFQKIIGEHTGISLTLLISCEKISINGIEHTNSYK